MAKSINVFLIDDIPTGRIKCTMQNWTGVAYKIPRKLLDECYKSGGNITKDIKQSGIYFLIGGDDDNLSIYVDQAIIRKNGDGILGRLNEHKKSKNEKYRNYWNEAICFTTTNNTFGPTEISYLENKFTNMAIAAKRYNVLNGNEPNVGNVTEEKESELEEFIKYSKIIMGVLGHKVFEPLIMPNQNEAKYEETKSQNNVRFSFAGSYKAAAELTNEGFVLLKGSEIRKELINSAGESTKKQRKLHEKDISNNVTTCDILFHSPSAASAFVAGRASNGNVEWKTVDGKSPKDL